MSLKIEEIPKIILELKNIIGNGRVQNIYQPSESSLTIEIRSGNKNYLLHISVEPQFARIHLIGKKYPNPASPYSFCMYLRKHLTGARIDEISQVKNDRIVIIRLSKNSQADGDAVSHKYNLIAELTGRTGNIILTDGDMKILMIALKRERRERDLRTGSVYTLPQPPILIPPQIALTSHLSPPSEGVEISSFNIEVEKIYRELEKNAGTERFKNDLMRDMRQRLKKLELKSERLHSDLDKLERFKDDNKKGELLKANFSLIKKGMDKIELKDYYNPSGESYLTIELDPSLSTPGNIERYFERYRKYKRGKEEILKHIGLIKKEILQLRKKLSEPIQILKQTPPIEAFEGRPPAEKKRRGEEKSSPRSFKSADGMTILAGRNNRQNDELTFKIAKGNDVWLHVRGFPGSHVIIKMENKKEIPRDSLLDAASLAIHFSKLKSAGRGDVIYTFRKYVRKPRGAEAGKVICSQDKNLSITIDSGRMERLFRDSR
ncbi:MAG: NFACT family protein [Nitrospinae bacterium]|nr:NFACT family protein [Nitrospinota bacterium]MBI3813737.1 NFACT family protein [Nitrospinota bacterium]